MTREAGYTIVELLVAAAVMLTVTGGVFTLLADGLGTHALWNESADLHQRGRAALGLLASELAAAGAGTPAGPLVRYLPPVEPRRRGVAASTTAITVRHVPDGAAWSTLAADLPPGLATARLVLHSGCPLAAAGCGFAAGSIVLIFDRAGNRDIASVQGVEADMLTLADLAGARSVTYRAGASIAEVDETTFYLDTAERQLRREGPAGSSMPAVDNVVDLQFSYFGDPAPPRDPVPPAGQPNCLYTSEGAPVAHAVLASDHGALAALPIAMLTDGPFCGSGTSIYDVDLLRIRAIRATVRLQTGVDLLRGRDPRLFARPGTATHLARMLPDAVLSIDLSPRNLQR